MLSPIEIKALRKEFALAALQGMVSNVNVYVEQSDKAKKDKINIYKLLATESVKLANALIKEFDKIET